ncbi:MAG: alpha/beta hydrolase [Myxococcota bacterium]
MAHTSLGPALSGPMWEVDSPASGPLAVYGPVTGGSPNQPPLLVIHSVNAAASGAEMRSIYDDMGRERPTYGFDLPGFGRSYRGPGPYTPRVMTDALLTVANEVQGRHGGQPLDAIALSTACEFLARAAAEQSGLFRTLALISPTGFDRRGRRDGPPGSTRGSSAAHAFFSIPGLSDLMFGLLTRPSVVRYFLKRAFGSDTIDEELWRYCVQSVRAPGAKHAPLYFLSGYLFSGDITPIYEALTQPVWAVHGVRGDFVDYTGLAALEQKPNWTVNELQTGALPHFEVEDDFMNRYREFLAAH